jgi:hypothetical protein
MAKIQTVGKISEVMGMDWNADRASLKKSISRIAESFGKPTVGLAAVVPINHAFAASAKAVNSCIKDGGGETFLNLHSSIMNAFSAGVVLVIIFSGAAWALGHRGRALEVLIGCCCGYILAIHAVDLRDFLSCI